MTRHHSCRVSTFGHPRIHARLTAPRGISQPPTSFIGSQCQGIHHAPLNTYNDNFSHKKLLYKPILEKLHIHTPTPHPLRKRTEILLCEMLATTIHKSNTTPHHQAGRQHAPQRRNARRTGLLPQSPIVCLAATAGPPGRTAQFVVAPEPTPTTGTGPSNESPGQTEPHTVVGGHQISWCSLERR